MKRSDYYKLRNKTSRFDYSIYKIGKPVEVPLLGRKIITAQKTLLTHAKRKGWKVETRVVDGKLYALREA